MAPAVVFFFVLLIPNKAPIEYSKPMDLAACLYEVHEFTSKPPHTVLIQGGILQVGCSIKFEKSEDH